MISIIIPVYNCEKMLSECLNSVLSQSYSDFEIICIDDGSKDCSGKILDEFALLDNRIKVQHIENQGQAYARNLGLELSSGEYICFVDADDSIDSNYLKKMMELMDNSCDLVICGMQRVFKKKASWIEKHFEYYKSLETLYHFTVNDKPEFLLTIVNAPYCKLIRKDFLNKHSIRFMKGKIYEDFFFTQSLLAHNPVVSVITDPLYVYYVYEGTTMTSKKSRTDDMYDVMDELLALYHNLGKKDLFFEELEYLSLHHIAIGTVYRSFRKNPFRLLNEVHKARQFLKKNHFSLQNVYFKKNASILVKAYLFCFFSFLF